MPAGPGKYDSEAMAVLMSTQAHAVILMVVGGDRSSGFSVCGTPEAVLSLPRVLRDIAQEIEKSMEPTT